MVFYTHSLSSFQRCKPQYQLKQLFCKGLLFDLLENWLSFEFSHLGIEKSCRTSHEMKGMNLFSGINHPRSRWLQLVRIVSINFPIRPPCIRGYSRRATVAAFKAKETPLLLQHSRDEQLLTNGCPFCHCRIFLPNTQRIVSLQGQMS